MTPQDVWNWLKMRNPGLSDHDIELIYWEVDAEVKEQRTTPVPTKEQLDEVQSAVETGDAVRRTSC